MEGRIEEGKKGEGEEKGERMVCFDVDNRRGEGGKKENFRGLCISISLP